MPDLSMLPESELAREAFNNPVLFGQQHQQRIADLIDIANLSLRHFKEATPQLEKALCLHTHHARYWAVIACTTFGQQAIEFAPLIRKLAAEDQHGLVRVRAAEYLGLTGTGDPVPTLMDALQKSTSDIEVGLMLNTVALLRDSPQHYRFNIPASRFTKPILKNDTVQRRLEYLAP
ncbi:MAG: HEAT repeat domain-containing protein [Planctomycetaceae bacterium]